MSINHSSMPSFNTLASFIRINGCIILTMISCIPFTHSFARSTNSSLFSHIYYL
ncbi:hypothetical protein BDV11DRAFT_197619 [Aspergillus similis]